MKVTTNVKAGGTQMQHNAAQVRPAGLKVQTGIKAGAPSEMVVSKPVDDSSTN